jgi:hypothetical protein
VAGCWLVALGGYLRVCTGSCGVLFGCCAPAGRGGAGRRDIDFGYPKK